MIEKVKHISGVNLLLIIIKISEFHCSLCNPDYNKVKCNAHSFSTYSSTEFFN